MAIKRSKPKAAPQPKPIKKPTVKPTTKFASVARIKMPTSPRGK